MPLVIPIKPQHAERINALIRDREAIKKESDEKVQGKNEIIAGLMSGHLIAAGHDPDTLKGNMHIETREGQPCLILDDPAGARPHDPNPNLTPAPPEPIDLKKPATSKKG